MRFVRSMAFGGTWTVSSMPPCSRRGLAFIFYLPDVQTPSIFARGGSLALGSAATGAPFLRIRRVLCIALRWAHLLMLPPSLMVFGAVVYVMRCLPITTESSSCVVLGVRPRGVDFRRRRSQLLRRVYRPLANLLRCTPRASRLCDNVIYFTPVVLAVAQGLGAPGLCHSRRGPSRPMSKVDSLRGGCALLLLRMFLREICTASSKSMMRSLLTVRSSLARLL